MYEITCSKSFISVRDWISQAQVAFVFISSFSLYCSQNICKHPLPKLFYDDVTQKRAPDDVIMMLLGNKNDAVKREVQIQEGADLARVRVHCDPKVLTVLLKFISTKSSVVFSLH